MISDVTTVPDADTSPLLLSRPIYCCRPKAYQHVKHQHPCVGRTGLVALLFRRFLDALSPLSNCHSHVSKTSVKDASSLYMVFSMMVSHLCAVTRKTLVLDQGLCTGSIAPLRLGTRD